MTYQELWGEEEWYWQQIQHEEEERRRLEAEYWDRRWREEFGEQE